MFTTSCSFNRGVSGCAAVTATRVWFFPDQRYQRDRCSSHDWALDGKLFAHELVEVHVDKGAAELAWESNRTQHRAGAAWLLLLVGTIYHWEITGPGQREQYEKATRASRAYLEGRK